MAGWQAGLLVLVQRVLQQLHVVLPANTAANNLQTGYQSPITAYTACYGHTIQKVPLLVRSGKSNWFGLN